MKIQHLVLTIFFIAIIAVSAIAMETKLSLELWNRYTGSMESGSITQSAFSFNRGYVRLEPTFNDNIKGRFNLDFFSDEDGLDGAGLKIKYAYIDFSNIVIPDAQFTFGLMKNYFATVYEWDYTSISAPIEATEKVISSTDLGAGISGKLFNGFAEYALQVMNGEGYTKAGSSIDLNPAFGANMRLNASKYFMIGGSVHYLRNGLFNAGELNDSLLTDTSVFAYSLVTRIDYNILCLWGEFLSEYNDSDNSYGYMIMPVLHLNNILPIDMDIIGRYDSWDEFGADNNHYSITAGVNVNILRDENNVPQITLQTNYVRSVEENAANAPENTLMLQLKWKFSHIWF